jgi:hypothetical protein
MRGSVSPMYQRMPSGGNRDSIATSFAFPRASLISEHGATGSAPLSPPRLRARWLDARANLPVTADVSAMSDEEVSQSLKDIEEHIRAETTLFAAPPHVAPLLLLQLDR